MDQLSKLGPMQAIAKFWGTLNSTQRFITAIFISTSVVLLLVVSLVATKPKMAVLFTGLESGDSGAIVAKLQESKIPYEVDGTAIKIPANKVHETRMQLASQGLPESSNVGFEIFDKSSFGMTEFSQRVSYQRALQGELSRTIDQLDGVMQSKVLISIPEESVFADEKKQPKASVQLKLRPGSQMGSDQVAGIVRLVSSAVEGLTPNQVAVVDTNGNLLSEPTDEATGLDPRLNASQLRLKRAYEHQVQQDIQSMLERVLGPNKSVVRVNAKINFDRKEKNSELYEPVEGNKGILLSEDRTEEAYSEADGRVGGIVGVRPALNPDSSVTEVTPVGEGGYQRVESSAKYEVSKTTEHVITAPGQVEKMSVAVMVDGKVDASKIPSIQNAVAAAAGIELERGDQITVESIAFDDTVAKEQAKEMKAVASKSTYLSVGKSVAGVLLLFAFLFFLKGMLKQIKVQVPESAGTVVEEIMVSNPVQMGQEPAVGSPLQGYDSPQVGTNDVVTLPNSEESSIQPKPQDIARALRAWMSES